MGGVQAGAELSLAAAGSRSTIDWYEAKRFVEHATNLSMDALHVIAGVFLFLGFCLLLRRAVLDMVPWLAVLIVTLVNEAADLWLDQWPTPAMQFGEAAKDIVMTMLIPTAHLAVSAAPAAAVRPQVCR